MPPGVSYQCDMSGFEPGSPETKHSIHMHVELICMLNTFPSYKLGCKACVECLKLQMRFVFIRIQQMYQKCWNTAQTCELECNMCLRLKLPVVFAGCHCLFEVKTQKTTG
jgi:hypothetical protein